MVDGKVTRGDWIKRFYYLLLVTMPTPLKKKSFWLLLPALLITVGFLPHMLDLIKANEPADTDNDGLADPWEITHFGDLTSQDGDGDPDGDGYYNEEEESLGLDPNVAGGLPGYLSHEGWTGIGGVQVSDLISHSKFHESPDVNVLTLGSESSLVADHYGSRLRGTITAPVSGSYTFWVAGDDGVEMWLSTDDRKFNRRRLAWHTGYTNSQQWDKYGTQQSAPVCLQAGQKYYLEILHKEGIGGDHVSVAWSYEADDLVNFAREPGVVATQSSVSSGGVASRAIDGNRDGYYWSNSTTHTDGNANNWWQADLGVDRAVERVILFNRTDCCFERLSNFRISVLDSLGNEVAGQDYHTEDGYVNGSLVWELETPAVGRTLKISLLGNNLTGNGVLSLAEVEIMGSASGAGNTTPLGYLTNWTQEAGVSASQSTTHAPAVASRAIDGNRNGHYPSGSVTHTDGVSANWWQVNLGAVRPVNRIAIYNRTDCCMNRLSNFRIVLLDAAGVEVVHKDFYPLEGHAGYQFKWDVPANTSAQTVRIESLGTNRGGNRVISLAEVEVLGGQGMLPGAILAREAVPSGALESYVLDPDDPDDDGLPSAWETQYGFDPNSTQGSGGGSFGDPDDDLVANWREYQLGTDPTTPSSIPGALTEEVWTGVPGVDLTDLYEHPKYLQGSDYRRLIYQSEGTRWLGDFTGTRIRGYIQAPVSGDYRFWVSGDDEVRFWMSDSEDKFNKELLVSPHLFVGHRQYDIEPSQQSRVVSLVAGQKYYIELHHKENGGGGTSPVSLAWQIPGGNRALIPAEHLYSYIRHSNDQDDDDLPDDWEVANGLDPADNGSTNPSNGYLGDHDNDGLANHRELTAGTRADLADTDGDGVSDYDEVTLLETEALAGDVAPFQTVQTVNGSTYSDSYGGWTTDGSKAYGTGVRGWVEYQINVPADGIYLLDLTVSPRIGGTLSDEYEMVFSIDGHFNERVAATIAEDTTGNMKTLTPWLTAGTHTVRVFNDNALTFRRVNLHSLVLQSSHGADADSNGTPDWVDARLARLNGIDSQMTTSQVSPVCIEGRARHTGLVSLSNGNAVTPVAGERWMTGLELDANTAVSLQATFENGGLVHNRSITWTPTNLLTGSAITLRQGDALRLTAFSGTTANGSDKVWLTHDGTTHYFKGNEPMEWHFENPGTYTFDVVHRRGNGNAASETTNSVTVTVVAPVTIESPVCVPGHVREWDLPALPAGAILEIDSRVELRDTTDLAAGAKRHLINSDAPETRYAHIRLGANGPILQTIPMRGLTLRDAEHTSMQFIQDFGDGSYQVDMPVVVSSVYPDVRVNYDIFVAGVTFDTGGTNKDYFNTDFNDLGQAKVTFIKTGTQGSACHRTAVWQGNKRIAYFY